MTNEIFARRAEATGGRVAHASAAGRPAEVLIDAAAARQCNENDPSAFSHVAGRPMGSAMASDCVAAHTGRGTAFFGTRLFQYSEKYAEVILSVPEQTKRY